MRHKFIMLILVFVFICLSHTFSNADLYTDSQYSLVEAWDHSWDTSLGNPFTAIIELRWMSYDDPPENTSLYADGHFLGNIGDVDPPITFEFTSCLSELQDGVVHMEVSNVIRTFHVNSTLYVVYNVPLIVINYFPSPDRNPRGLAWDGTYLWHCDTAQPKIYKLNKSGKVISSITWPYNEPYGLTHDGTNLWVCDNTEDNVYEVTTNGEILSSFKAPGNLYGITWDGNNLWLTVGESLYKMNKKGEVLEEYQIGVTMRSDIAFDGEYLWIANYEGYISKLNTSGDEVETFNIERNDLPPLFVPPLKLKV